MAHENQKANAGGLAYEVILKPAAGELPRPSSPPKDKGITQEDIMKKLQLAEERRQSTEKQKLDLVAKQAQRAIEAQIKATTETEKFARATQEKMRRSMEVHKENRDSQIHALQGRLRDHLLKVEETCRKSDQMTRELEERIKNNLEQKNEKRNAQIETMVQRLKEHAEHINEVIKTSENKGKMKISEEVIVNKLQKALKNREIHLQALQDRLKEHEKKIEEVRKNKTSVVGDHGDDQTEVIAAQ